MSAQRAFVTGCAGFIGSHLCDALLARGDAVIGFDDFSTGQAEFLAQARTSPRFRLVRGDARDASALGAAMTGADIVYHLAANADVRFGTLHPRRDLEQNTVATVAVLEAMRATGVPRIAFASSGAVYGDAALVPTPEDAALVRQTSLYGASKAAAEAFVQAFSEGYGMQSWIFRFVSVVGERYAHGHVFDFCRSLRRDPSSLRVLGDGKQRKSYLHVADCVDGVLTAVARADARINVLNLGTDETCAVDDSVRWITERLGVAPRVVHAGGDRGWVGDSPLVHLDCRRARKLGWAPRASIREGIVRTVDWLEANAWIYAARP
jgi:UDP-glucose 4-epimerase